MQLSGIRLIDRALNFESRAAIVDRRGSHTYGDLSEASGRAAAGLLGGTRDLQEARVALMVAPGCEYVAAQWGVWRAGGVVLPLSLRDPAAELEYQVDDAGTSVLVVDAKHEQALRPIAEARGLRLELVSQLLGSGSGPTPTVDEVRRAMIVYTSGTTSRPKGVVTTHANIRAQVGSLVTAWEWSVGDHILHTLPLHHVHGIINALACALWAGATCEMLPAFDPDVAWRRLASGEFTVYMAVPTVYRALIKAWNEASPSEQASMSKGVSGLRLMVSGSDKLEVATLEEWREISGHVLLERYGMTEIGMALSNPLHGERMPGTVGSPLPNVDVRVVELDTDVLNETGAHRHGELVTDARPGELQVRGPSIFKEYWGKPEITATAFPEDGWFCTGDIVEETDGVYRILGRASQDFMISGGENVNLREVEEAVSTHPDVEACAVVGVPDDYWGKAVSAALVLKDGATMTTDELREWCRNRLAPHTLPQKVLVSDSLPRTAIGKVIKPQVVRLFQAAEGEKR